jgi:hypothetical protein
MGSGLDQYRKPESAAEECAALRRSLGCDSAAMYVYQSDWTSNTLTPAWFQRLYDAYRLNIDLSYYSQEAENFVKQALLSRISRENQKIDVGEAVDNMRLNLVGQSFGGTFCRMISNSLKKEMRDLGYADNEIQEVFDNVLAINISGASRAVSSQGEPMFKEIYIEHIYDFICWQTDRSNVHPYFNEKNSAHQWITVSDRMVFLWSDFTWGQAAGQVPRPRHDSYGFHTVGAMTSSLDMQMITAVFDRARKCEGRLPPLVQLIQGIDYTSPET